MTIPSVISLYKYMAKTYLGLGSNIGDREGNLIRAISLIKKTCNLLNYSSIYLTSPVGYSEQADFLNMAIEVDSGECEPFELLSFVKSIERKIGRRKTFRWGPRLIDIDILYMEGISIFTQNLTIPHSEMFNRLFVLVPLSELADSLIIDNMKTYLTDAIARLSSGKNMRDYSTMGVSLFKERDNVRLHG
jgi:2-amino-4-hydroxy-6-hydroxymethyldihydropteridine diphosphokinase